MVFLAGIDEAGYGPFVGPFVVGYSLFRVPHPKIDLWQHLEKVAAKKPLRKKEDRRLWVNDSKKVHSGPRGRKRLERTVAAFRELLEASHTSADDWITADPCGDARWLDQAPWFREMDGPFCPGASPDRARLDAASLHRRLQDAGCTLDGFGARAVPACEWNHLLSQTRNKGDALFLVTMEVVRHLFKKTGDAPLRLELDRHGARAHYAEKLRVALNPEKVITHGETSGGSTYTLQFPNREVQLRFSEKADLNHFSVALASLAAKQTRERMMDGFNAWWQEQLPDVAPTKGYGVDGKRWLADVLPQLESVGTDEKILRRSR
jgi:ribonuclease HII